MIKYGVTFEESTDEYGDPIPCPQCGESIGKFITFDRAGTRAKEGEEHCQYCEEEE